MKLGRIGDPCGTMIKIAEGSGNEWKAMIVAAMSRHGLVNTAMIRATSPGHLEVQVYHMDV